jgi:hypothetical protein
MSALGHKRTFRSAIAMLAQVLLADHDNMVEAFPPNPIPPLGAR